MPRAKPKSTKKKLKRKRPQQGLTPKRLRFVAEYLASFDATRAARAAGYSENSVMSLGCQLLKDPKVAAEIAKRTKRVAEKFEVSSERIMRELSRVAFGDPRRVLSWGPRGVTLRPSDELTDDEAAAVSSVAQTKGRSSSLKVSLHDKVRALEILAKCNGMMLDRVKVENPEELARQIAEAQAAIAGGDSIFPAPPEKVRAA